MDPDSCLSFLKEWYDGIAVASLSGELVAAGVCAILLLCLSGVISASESAFFALSPEDKDKLNVEKSSADRRIRSLLNAPEHLLATILVSNSFVNVAAVVLGVCFFSGVVGAGGFSVTVVLLCTFVLAVLSLGIGEVVPRICSARYALDFCRRVVPVICFLYVLFKPVSGIFARSSSFCRMVQKHKRANLSVDELSQALELADKDDILEENNMLEGIIRFGEETVKEVMTSRMDMVDLDIKTPYPEVLRCIVENTYSRIPVYKDSRDNIKGILYIKDLIPYLTKGDDFEWQSLVRPAYFIPETKMIDDLLRDFQANKIHIAIVVDEFGGTSGLVTMEDIIEEIVGEINDEYDEEEHTFVKLSDNVYIFEGKTQLSDFYKITGTPPDEFEEATGDADTLAGMVLELKGEFPSLHEVVRYKRFSFEVLEMDDRRIVKVKVIIGTEEKSPEG